MHNGLLYLSSRWDDGTILGSPFSKVLSINSKDIITLYDLPSDKFLKKNPYKNFPTHAIGPNTMILSDPLITGSQNHKIYKFIDGELNYNTEGKTIQKDVVVVKETFDPVISRKSFQYFCYSNPKPAKDNKRIFYSNVIQQNDINGVLGSSVTFYDSGLSDIRRQGLPNKLQSYDAEHNLLSEQKNYWELCHDNQGSYYINLKWKKTTSKEGDKEFKTTDWYAYEPSNGLLKYHKVDDSEGNEHVTETEYLYEHFPEVLDDNLLQPIVKTKSYNKLTGYDKQYLSATAVEWDVSGVPYPKKNYSWNGTGLVNFDFNSPPDNYRKQQEIMLLDNLGNILQEKNRSDVITSYIYGYDNKRLVAKIEGATYSQAIALVNTTVINNPPSETALMTELQNLRNGLSEAYVTSYTYHLGIGLTTATDIRGRTTKYVYDDFYRLSHIVDHDGHILKQNTYQYREAPFQYETLSTDTLDCPLVNTDIIGNPEGIEIPPLSLHLTKQSGNARGALFALSTSGQAQSSYSLFWSYNAISGNVFHFPYTIHSSNLYLNSSNPDCNPGVLSIIVLAKDANGNTIASSNVVNHTYAPNGTNCQNQ